MGRGQATLSAGIPLREASRPAGKTQVDLDLPDGSAAWFERNPQAKSILDEEIEAAARWMQTVKVQKARQMFAL